MTKFSRAEGCWTYLCDFGCRASDFESDWEARQAELAHICRSARR